MERKGSKAEYERVDETAQEGCRKSMAEASLRGEMCDADKVKTRADVGQRLVWR